MAPNLLESARRYFAGEILPFPFVCDPNMRCLHHHAMTAQEQGIFLVDKEGVIRHLTIVGPIDPVRGGVELAELARTHCAGTPVPA